MDSVALFLETNRISERTRHKNKRRIYRNNSNINQLSDTGFKKNFRLNKAAFAYVWQEIRTKFPRNTRSDSVSPEQKLAACLRFLAEGNYQHGVGKDYHIAMGQSTFSNCFKEVLNILEEALCPKWISLRMTNEEKQLSKMHFFEKTGFPGIISCLDGTHIKIIAPKENKHLFLNRKGFYSLNVLIICDFKMRIRGVNANFQGANHDSHVWNMSPQRQHFEEDYQSGLRDSWLLGDSGYALEPWLMTPFRMPTAYSAESRYNKSHSKARNIVERTIGLLKSRFRCILGARQLHYDPKKAAQIVNVCCALHNICLHFSTEEETAGMDDFEEIDSISEESNEIPRSSHHSEAIATRNEILMQFE